MSNETPQPMADVTEQAARPRCERHPTIDELAAAGVTWDELGTLTPDELMRRVGR